MTRTTLRVGAKVALPLDPRKNQEKNQCATAAVVCVSSVVPRRREPAPPLTGPETAAAARRLVASLRGMGDMAPRPGQAAWVDPIDPCDLGPLSDERGAA